MSDVFMDKDIWLSFAEEHNATANLDATQLNGSDSYTLVAIHLSARVPIPRSVLLDTKRAHGKFVADHFRGLRNLHESGTESSRWLPDILEQSRKFAQRHSVDYNDMIINMINITERKVKRSMHNKDALRKEPQTFYDVACQCCDTVYEADEDDDVKI